MAIKTSLNLKSSQSSLLYALAKQFDVSLSFILNSLARKIFKSRFFSVRFLSTVQYQERLNNNDYWDPVPVSFEGDVYEKCQDMRRVFKVSVSLVFALAIKKYLDELIQELKGEKDGDNYTTNYLLLFTGSGCFKQIILLWDMIEPKKIEKFHQIHTET